MHARIHTLFLIVHVALIYSILESYATIIMVKHESLSSGEARPFEIALEAIYLSSFLILFFLFSVPFSTVFLARFFFTDTSQNVIGHRLLFFIFQ